MALAQAERAGQAVGVVIVVVGLVYITISVLGATTLIAVGLRGDD